MEPFITISALDAGHLTLPERLFVTDADPDKRTTVPSLSFLIQHFCPGSATPTRLLFDLGVKRDIQGYTASQQAHIAQRRPIIVSPDCGESILTGDATIGPKDIDLVILSHVHWDHVGTSSDFPSATFLVGAGTLDLLKHGDGPLYPADLFNDDELPPDRTVELPLACPSEVGPDRPKQTPPSKSALAHIASYLNPYAWAWKPLSTFPAALDLFGDGTVMIIDAPGHLYGHVNLLCRVAEARYVYLGGDCCHDPRILAGEKGIALYEDGRGGLRSVHVDTEAANTTLNRIRGFVGSHQGKVETEVIVAHDAPHVRVKLPTRSTCTTRKQTTHAVKLWRHASSVYIMSSPANTVAFIGLGVMGYPMAKNLWAGLGPDETLLICDVNTDALERFISETSLLKGNAVKIVQNGFEAAQQADTVITMLPNSDAVLAVYLNPSTGILPALAEPSDLDTQSPKLLIECGTIESSTIFSVSRSIPQNRATFVDAPVSGGPMGAQNQCLTFMVGCPPSRSASVFPLVKSYLCHMGDPNGIFLCGDVGAGTAFKIINNYLSAITSLAASEALNIGVKAGLDPKLLTQVINASGGQCWVTSKSNPVPEVQDNVPSSRGYEGGFRIELCAKVLGMGSKLASDVGARTVLDQPTLSAFREAMEDERYKGKDARVVFKWLNDQ
ncbi:NAD binding domain of 6-phosphogluconate dehydrogenase-domain-containing protein [Triangularia verruculosa]|uniref:3-hydroxyisobutyrate dehydrogenase n=1 Tax=Triangularia verruculosa TaxID=2587418 RepID=A0AAN6XBX8_9PEZI|nr:NAD binding domain of 6-phosphogluconate dehydrogenase-domain-containing protein [Triangularia verruculosa]